MDIKAFIKENILWISIILILIIALITSRIGMKNESDRFQNNYDILESAIETYKLENDQLVYSKRQLEVTNSELESEIFIKNDSLIELVDQFKSVKSTVQIKIRTVIDSILIPFDNPITIPFKKDFFKEHENYLISGSVNNDGLELYDLSIPANITFVSGYKKKGFFNRELVLDMIIDNPLIEIQDIESQVVIEPIKRFGIGPYVGYDSSLKPSFGLSFHYSLIKF